MHSRGHACLRATPTRHVVRSDSNINIIAHASCSALFHTPAASRNHADQPAVQHPLLRTFVCDWMRLNCLRQSLIASGRYCRQLYPVLSRRKRMRCEHENMLPCLICLRCVHHATHYRVMSRVIRTREYHPPTPVRPNISSASIHRATHAKCTLSIFCISAVPFLGTASFDKLTTISTSSYTNSLDLHTRTQLADNCFRSCRNSNS